MAKIITSIFTLLAIYFRLFILGHLLVTEGGGWGVVERYVRNQGKPRESLRQLALF